MKMPEHHEIFAESFSFSTHGLQSKRCMKQIEETLIKLRREAASPCDGVAD
jgi:hypothetical protein